MGTRQTIAEHLGAVGDSAFGKFDKKDVELLMAGREYHSAEESCTDSAEEREEQDEEGGGEQPWLLSASKIITVEPWWRAVSVSIPFLKTGMGFGQAYD